MAELVNIPTVAWITERRVASIASWIVSYRVFLAMNELNTERIAREVGVDESIVTAIATRLRLVQGDLSDAGFFALVRDVVRTKVRFAERDAKEDLAVVRLRQRDD
jgi:hypothetical protein